GKNPREPMAEEVHARDNTQQHISDALLDRNRRILHAGFDALHGLQTIIAPAKQSAKDAPVMRPSPSPSRLFPPATITSTTPPETPAFAVPLSTPTAKTPPAPTARSPPAANTIHADRKSRAQSSAPGPRTPPSSPAQAAPVHCRETPPSTSPGAPSSARPA